jgi:hypothetical protein
LNIVALQPFVYNGLDDTLRLFVVGYKYKFNLVFVTIELFTFLLALMSKNVIHPLMSACIHGSIPVDLLL